MTDVLSSAMTDLRALAAPLLILAAFLAAGAVPQRRYRQRLAARRAAHGSRRLSRGSRSPTCEQRPTM